MTTHRRFLTVRSFLSAVCFAVLVAGAAAAQTAPCPEGGAPTAVCTFVDDAWPYDVFLEQACTRSLMAGCGDEYACPGEAVLREDMAVSLERLYRGHTFNPSAACASQCTFADFKASYCLAGWICQLFKDGITAGCAAGYCGPEAVRREQMAVFLSIVISKRLGQPIPSAGEVCLSSLGCKPYTCVDQGQPGGVSAFTDVSATGNGYCKFIHYIAAKGITSGCGNWQFCPSATIARQEMAVFLIVSDNLIAGTPLPTTNPCQ